MRHRSRRIAVCVPSFLAQLVGPRWALAAENAAHAEHHAPSVGDLLFPAINFALFAFIMGKYLVPALREYLRRRRESIVSEVQEATAALQLAEQAVADARARLAGIAAEAETIRNDLINTASHQADRLRNLAEENGKRRLMDAALVAEQERRRALQSVRAEIAALATNAAERKIRAALSADDQREYVRQFLKDASTQ